ncbi:hypothetical protein QIS99_21985 [Streptomyces sp. B-S-A8]|uniref:Uncharacterized protein n=1 Tax=Streptomyces solicavernae TaxID=3043614 RepID=A0ABT6RWM1_9ACTN|nr:hypothetical protein [Streptomyces sp. B-S-A8]MDI3388842.1 hypothetical protein [Streptomyces sp. B-S-A8]
MRPARDTGTDRSATPIYDALYSEWRRSFRALPGDRSGEEDLRFRGFAAGSGYPGGGSAHTGYTPPGFWFAEPPQRPAGDRDRPRPALPPARRRES